MADVPSMAENSFSGPRGPIGGCALAASIIMEIIRDVMYLFIELNVLFMITDVNL